VARMYFGRPGSLFSIPHPRGGVRSTRVRPSAVFQTASGLARVGKTSDGARQYTLSWDQLTYETYASLEAFDHGHQGPGPFALIDAARINMLTVNQSAATSLLNDTDDFSVVGPGGTLGSATTYSRGPRALSWNFSVASDGLVLAGASGDFASTPDTAALDITGDIDIRADVTLNDWVSGASQALVAKYIPGTNQRSYMMWLNSTGQFQINFSDNGTNAFTMTSTVNPTPDPDTGRLALRVTLDVNNGAGGRTGRFYTAPTMDGPWTQLGADVVQATAISLFASTSNLYVGARSDNVDNVHGVFHAVEVRNGIDGTAVANPVFEDKAEGTTSFADAAGRTWTLNGTAAIDVIVDHLLTLDSPAVDWPGIPVVSGIALTFTCVAKGAGTDAIMTVTAKLKWLDSAGATLSTDSGSGVASNSSTFQTVTVANKTPPANAVYVLCQVGITGQSAGSILYLDKFQLEAAPAGTTWRPGTGVLPVAVASLSEEWPWEASTFRANPTLVLQEVA
jgi:hypothetical protein